MVIEYLNHREIASRLATVIRTIRLEINRAVTVYGMATGIRVDALEHFDLWIADLYRNLVANVQNFITFRTGQLEAVYRNRNDYRASQIMRLILDIRMAAVALNIVTSTWGLGTPP